MRKKFFLAALLSIFTAMSFSFYSCKSSTPVEEEITGTNATTETGGTSQPVPFDVKITDVATTSVSILVSPLDTAAEYIAFILTNSSYQCIQKGIMKTHMVFPYEDMLDYAYSTLEHGNIYLTQLFHTGSQKIETDKLKPGTEYIFAMYKANQKERKILEEISVTPFKTTSAPVKEAATEFTLTYEDQEVRITPSDDHPYFCCSLSKSVDKYLDNDYSQESLSRIAKIVYDLYIDAGYETGLICHGNQSKPFSYYDEGDYSYLAVPFSESQPCGKCTYISFHHTLNEK